MARKRKYRKADNSPSAHARNFFSSAFRLTGRFFVRIFKIFDEKLTVMIVPHSQGKVINIQTNVFAMFLGIIIIGGIVGSFVYFNKRNIGAASEISRLREENRETLASFDELRDETNNNLLPTGKKFQSSLNKTLSLLGINQSSNVPKSTSKNSDLSSLFDTQNITSGSLKETTDVKQLTSYLESAIQPVEQIGKMLENQNSLFADIPNIWPIKN